MQLETYISDLLYRYDCVTIPNLGSFLTKRIAASWDESAQSFQPPRKSLSFNEQIQSNDGLLASHLAETEKLPYKAAVKKIAKHVKSIKSYLVEGETISFKHIGDIQLNKDGRIVFTPSYQINYLTDSFGLSTISVPEVLREHAETPKVVPLEPSPTKRKTIPLWRYAAIGIVGLGLAGAVSFGIYSNSIEKHNQIALEEANQALEQRIQEATFVIESPLPAATLKVERNNGKFHIVAGAFRVEENAEKIVAELRQSGFKARNLGANRYGLHEVVYQSFEDRTEAYKELRNIRRNVNSEAWLLVKNLQ